MRSMSEYQAELYVKAGYFPLENDIDDIVDLQDVFGHQRYWSNIRLLYDAETKTNAEKLFRLIWSADQVDNMKAEAERIHQAQKEKVDIEAQIAELMQKKAKLDSKINEYKFKMIGSDDADYYTEWGFD